MILKRRITDKDIENAKEISKKLLAGHEVPNDELTSLTTTFNELAKENEELSHILATEHPYRFHPTLRA